MNKNMNCICSKCEDIIHWDDRHRHLYGEHKMDGLSPSDIYDEFEYFPCGRTSKIKPLWYVLPKDKEENDAR